MKPEKMGTRRLLLLTFRSLLLLMIFSVTIFSYPDKTFAAPPDSPYAPGDTIAPDCAPGSSNCTVRMQQMQMSATNTQVIFNDNGTMNGTSTFWFDKSTGVVTVLGSQFSNTTSTNSMSTNSVSANATATNSFVSNASITNASTTYLSIASLSGFLRATAGAVGTALINLASDVTGILGIGNGGTGTSTLPLLGNILIGNNSGGYNLVGTSSLGFITTDVAEGANKYYTDQRVDDRIATLLQTGPGIDLSYDDIFHTLTISSTGGGGSGGTDENWTYFNNVLHPATSTSQVIVGNAAAFGPSKLQITGGTVMDNSTTTNAVITNAVVASLTAGAAKVGSLTGLIWGTSGLLGTIATSSLGFNTGNVPETTNLYYLDSRSRSAISETVPGIDYSTSTGIFSLTSGYVIPTAASTTEWSNNIASTNSVTVSNSLLSANVGLLNATSSLLSAGLNVLNASTTNLTSLANSLNSTTSSLTSTANTLLASTTALGELSSILSASTTVLTASTTNLSNAASLMSASVNLLSASTTSLTSTVNTLIASSAAITALTSILSASTTVLTASTTALSNSTSLLSANVGLLNASSSIVSANLNLLNASSTLFSNFYNDPSIRISAGSNLTWNGSALGLVSAPSFATTTISGMLTLNGMLAVGGLINGAFLSGGSLSSTLVNGITTSDILVSTSIYSNPSWLTGLAGTKISGNISGNAANVTGIVSLANGGTGTTTAPLLGQLIAGNGNGGYSYVSTSTLGVISSALAGLQYVPSTGVLSLASGYVIPLAASSTEWANSVALGNVLNASTTVLTASTTALSALVGSLTSITSGLTSTVSSHTSSVSTLLASTSALTASTTVLTASTTNLSNAASLLSANVSLLNASSTLLSSFYSAPSSRISVGTNLTWSGNSLLFNGTTDTVPEGVMNLFWLPSRFDARLSATTSLPNIATLGGLTSASSLVTVGALASGSIGSGFGNINIGANTFTGIGSGLTSLNAGNITSGILSIARGGTGTTTAPFLGQLMMGNGSGGYSYLATSTLAINTNDLIEGSNQFWTNTRFDGRFTSSFGASFTSNFNSTFSGAFDMRLSATTSLPNITTLAGLTSLPGLTLNGDISANNRTISGLAALTVTGTAATSTFSTGGLNIGNGQFVVVGATGRVGIGSANPQVSLYVKGDNGGNIARFETSAGGIICNITSSLGGILSCASDRRLKKDIVPLDGSSTLDKILALNPVTYLWKTDADESRNKYGFIAQDVEQIFPDLVETDPSSGIKTLGMTALISPLVKAVQEMQVRFTASIASTTLAFQTFVSNPVFGSASKPAGITIYDQDTGTPYCVGMKSGQWVHAPGTCSDVGLSASGQIGSELGNGNAQGQGLNDQGVTDGDAMGGDAAGDTNSSNADNNVSNSGSANASSDADVGNASNADSNIGTEAAAGTDNSSAI